MSKEVEIKWLGEPEEHDYPAALSYLSLHYDEQTAATFVDKLRLAAISKFKAKDIFRASGLSLLGISNAHVEKDQQKIQSGRSVSASPPGKRFGQWEGCHCGRVSSTLCSLLL